MNKHKRLYNRFKRYEKHYKNTDKLINRIVEDIDLILFASERKYKNESSKCSDLKKKLKDLEGRQKNEK